MIRIFTDGGFLKAKNIAGYAFAVYNDNERIHSDGNVVTTTPEYWNITGELEAVIQAVTYANNHDIAEFELHYDYSGIEHWANGSWKAKNELTKQYADFMQQQTAKITFVKVKGHSGNPQNEYVDELCTKIMKNWHAAQKSQQPLSCPICENELTKYKDGIRICSVCPASFTANGEIDFMLATDFWSHSKWTLTEYLELVAKAINSQKFSKKTFETPSQTSDLVL